MPRNKFKATHGMSDTRLYKTWQNMKNRCYNSNVGDYAYYGGRGILVCDEWYTSFESFMDWSFANGYDDALALERENVNGNYEPHNCKWATRKAQASNKRNNTFISYNGKSKTAYEWAAIVNINPRTINTRLRAGWSIERALTTPARKGNYGSSTRKTAVTTND